MEKPEILGANICGCAFTGDATWVAIAGAVKVGGPAAAAAFCIVPMVATVMSVGLLG